MQVSRRIQGGGLFHKVLDNTLWQLVDKVLRLTMGVVVGVWIARYLGPARFGLLSYAIAFVALFSAIADGGMQTVVVRDLVRRKPDRTMIMCSALFLRLGGAIVAILAAVLLLSILRPSDSDALLIVFIISLSLVPQALDVIDYEYQSRLQSRPIVLTRAISFGVFSCAKLVLILTGSSIYWFAWAVVGEAALSALMMSGLSQARLSFIVSLRSTKSEMIYLMKTCWPLTIAGVSVMLYMRIDQIMLGQMLGDSAVGTFSAAVRISESWYFAPTAVISSIAPALISIMERSESLYRQRLQNVTRLLFWLSVAVAFALSLGSQRLISLLYGPNYSAAASVLVIHAWAGVFVSLGVAASPWFVNSGLLVFKMVQTLAGAIINIAMNLYMIRRFGVVGAAISTLVSYAVSAVLLNAFSKRTRPMFLIQAKAILIS